MLDALGRALGLAQSFSPCLTPRVNLLRHALAGADAEISAVGTDLVIASLAARMRATAGADLDDPRLHELIGELTLKSELFRETWRRHDVEPPPSSGRYVVDRPYIGRFELVFEKFAILGAATRPS